MSSLINFLQSDHVIALLVAVLIFITTIFLVAKRWIGFSITLLLLLFSLTTGLLINNQQTFQNYLNPSSHPAAEGDSQEAFQKHISQAVEDLQLEVRTEKENLRLVTNQVREITDHLEAQKQKLESFIEETHEHFKGNQPSEKSTSTL